MEKQHLLEITLISAQGLKPISGRRLQTYAIAWVDSTTKLRTRIDRVGGENPTWNDKFLFRVTDDFLASETSSVAVEIYTLGLIRDTLIGSVRFLINNFLPPPSSAASSPRASTSDAAGGGDSTPSFTAVHIRRPSGRFNGVLNIAAMVIDASDFAALTSTATEAMGFRDFMGESFRRRSFRRGRRTKSEQFLAKESFDTTSSCGDSADLSDGAESTTSSSSSQSTVLKDLNGMRDVMRSDRLGLLCGLPMQRRIPMSPSEPNLQSLNDLDNK